MEKKVAIIILTCNQEELLKKCLSSLKEKTEYKNYKTYVIDDSGKDYLSKRIKNNFKWVKFYSNKINLGYSKSINLGMKIALKEYSPDYLLLLNDDMEFIEKDWLKKMIKVGEYNKKIGVLGCKLIYPDRSLQWFFKNGKMHFFKTQNDIQETKETFKIKEVEDIFGACTLIKKEVVEEIGFFDENFSPLYGEDTDFCYRAGKKGFKIIYVGDTKIIHYGSASKKILEFNGGKWFLQKKHAIRLEWLNFKLSKIVKYTFIHFGSAILSKNSFERLKLLFKAYKENLKNIKEIKQKRKERFSWERQSRLK
ncbi:MAG TPA: glycosyltransferase family 2 protein [Candidatus Pacearchaeota archaeon]|nr:glycosyltransferase family 2 protein [Candidatus Pacearchaeota archaeon]